MHKEKSKNIFEDSKDGTIGARIKVLLEKTGKAVSRIEEDGGIGNGTLKGWKDWSLEKSNRTILDFLNTSRINPEWWKTGKGEIFITPVHMATDNKEKPLREDTPEEIYRKIVEGGTEYLLIPRSALEGKYRLVAMEQFIANEKEMERKENELIRKNDELIRKDNQIIGLYELFKLMAATAKAELPEIKETKKKTGV